MVHADKLLSEPAPVLVLGINETHRGQPRWSRCELTNKWVKLERFETNFLDLGGPQGLLGQAIWAAQGQRDGPAERSRSGLKGPGADRRAGPVRDLPRRNPPSPVERPDRRRPLPPARAGEQGLHRRPEAW